MLNKFIKYQGLKSFATLLSGTTLAQLIALLIYPLITRLYGSDDMGVFGTYMTLAAALGVLATAKYEQAIMLPKTHLQGYHVLVLSLMCTLFISLGLLVIILVFAPLLSNITLVAELNYWLYVLPLSVFFAGLMKSMVMWANRKKYFKAIAANNIYQSSFGSAFKLGLGMLGYQSAGLITGTIAGNGITALILTRKMIRKDQLLHLKISLKKVKYWSRHFINFPKYELPQGVINTLSGNLPVLFFASYFSTTAAGFYFLGFNVVFRPLSLISGAVEQVISQRLIAMNNEKKPIAREAINTLKILFGIAVIPSILFGLFTPQIFSFVFSESWTEAGKYVQILMPWLFLVYLAGPFSFIPNMYYQQRKAMNIEFIYFVLRVISLIIGIVNQDLILALILFSIAGFIVLTYKLFWYFALIRKNQIRDV
ncbi:MAG: lipopolysaccharide biosynthesis protein [Bacteroidota bacterium]